MEHKEIVNIKTGNIHPHPDNPRKDLGDLTELAESIKKNGIMQNLTVIPMDGEPGEYLALIGNRRSAAARLAGIGELPCRIVENMAPEEQLAAMLEENMQRNDLTIYEQAQGFQMMLDLGGTEEQIAEKTGFSRATVRHRLNIAKLDQAELRKKQQDEGFQLTLKDLYELEKVGDIDTRNKILKEARNSRDIAWKAQAAAAQAARMKIAGQIVQMLEKLGVKKAPEAAEREMYSGKWETVKEISLEKDAPKAVKLPKEERGQLFHLTHWRTVSVIKEAKKQKKKETPEEIASGQLERNKKEIKARMKEIDAARRDFILNIISGKIDAAKDEDGVKDKIWISLIELGAYLSQPALRRIFTNKFDYDCTQEEKCAADEKTKSLSTLHQMMAMLHYSMQNAPDICTYRGFYNMSVGEKLEHAYEILKVYGWSFPDAEAEQVINGTHELYIKEEAADGQ